MQPASVRVGGPQQQQQRAFQARLYPGFEMAALDTDLAGGGRRNHASAHEQYEQRQRQYAQIQGQIFARQCITVGRRVKDEHRQAGGQQNGADRAVAPFFGRFHERRYHEHEQIQAKPVLKRWLQDRLPPPGS